MNEKQEQEILSALQFLIPSLTQVQPHLQQLLIQIVQLQSEQIHLKGAIEAIQGCLVSRESFATLTERLQDIEKQQQAYETLSSAQLLMGERLETIREQFDRHVKEGIEEDKASEKPKEKTPTTWGERAALIALTVGITLLFKVFELVLTHQFKLP